MIILSILALVYLIGSIIALFLVDRSFDRMSKEELLNYDVDFHQYYLEIAISSWYVVYIYYKGWVEGFWDKAKEELKDDDDEDKSV